MPMPTDPTTAIALLTERVEALGEHTQEMKIVLQTLTEAVNRLALIEERQAQFAQAQERAFKAVEKLEIHNEKQVEKLESAITKLADRIGALEQERSMTKHINQWVMLAIQTTIGLVVLVALKKLGWLG